ncbi:MAG: hypothetical protein ACFE89_06345 [Candidatus Hodarchaeota archaeon]
MVDMWGARLLQLPFDWLTLTAWFILLFAIWLIATIFYNMYEEKRQIPGVSQWIAQKGKILCTQAEFKSGIQLSVSPSDPRIQRLDLGSFRTRDIHGNIHSFFRMRLHLALDAGIHFDLTPKRFVPGGMIFEPGEAIIGIDAIDQAFYTETTMYKETAHLLQTPKILTILEELHELRKLQVKGDVIELTFKRKVELLETMYRLARTIAYRLEELYI